MPQGRLRRGLVYGLFFVSGAAALVYQVAWTRNLTLVFGASHEAVAVVLGSFMAGLALGGFVCGRFAQRASRALVFYGLLEVGIALFALLVPPLLGFANRVYVAVALGTEGVPAGLHLLRVALSFVVLLLPTFLMGGTLPVLVRFLTTSSEQLGRRLSTLYAINTAGAVAGTVAATFVLLPRLGVSASQHVAVGVSLAVGLGALALGTRGLGTRGFRASWFRTSALRFGDDLQARRTGPHEEGVRGIPPPDLARMVDAPAAGLRLSFLGTAVAGFCALALEVMWMRAIAISTGTTAYSFGAMLATFLTGIALGGWLNSVLPLRRFAIDLRFGAVMSAAGVSVLVATQTIPRLPQLATTLNAALYPDSGGLRTATTLALGFGVMLVPCLFMGMAFPLAGEARMALRGDVGRSTGDLIALNTLGAIVGSLVAGFLIIPALGLQLGMLLVGGVYAAFGVLVLGAAARARPRCARWGGRTIVAATAVLALVAPLALPRWDVRILAAFRNNDGPRAVAARGETSLPRYLEGIKVLYYDEGISSNVSVVESGGQRALLIDGKVVASDRTSDLYHELMLGTLPMLLHPHPKSAVVVGLGAGVTLSGVLDHPTLERAVVVEIEPAVESAARLFSHVNDAALDDPRLEIVFQDGRNYLQTTAERFDVITADPIHPWARGAAYLYTTEYYRMLGEHLTDGGVMCQWLPLYELSLDNIRAVVGTFADNFEHTTVWQAAYDIVLIGSHAPLRVDLETLAERLEHPSVGRPLAQVGLGDPMAVLADLTIDEDRVPDFVGDAPRNTDDNLYLEFSSPLSHGYRFQENTLVVDREREHVAGPVVPVADEREWVEYRNAKSEAVRAEIAFDNARRDGRSAAFEEVIANLDQILARWPRPTRARYLASLARTHYGLALLREERVDPALRALEEAVATMPELAEARFHLASLLLRSGDPAPALEHLEIALREQPSHAQARLAYGLALQRLGRIPESIDAYRTAARDLPLFADAHYRLALAFGRAGSFEESIADFRVALALDPSLPSIHANYAGLLASRRQFSAAIAILEEGVRHEPGSWALVNQLAWTLVTAPDAAKGDTRRARNLLRRAVELAGEPRPALLDTEAAVLAAEGRFEEAQAATKSAAAAWRAQGETGRARQALERAALYEEGRRSTH